MAVTSEMIARVAALIEETGSGEDSLARLRSAMPELHFTQCHDDDVFGPGPVHQAVAFNLYLVDGRNHCLTLTSDPHAATGLVVAEVEV